MKSQPLYNGQTEAPKQRSVVSRILPTLPKQMTTSHYTAIAIFIVGTWLSRSALVQFGVQNVLIATVAAFVLQWFLTKAEQPIWKRGMPFAYRFTLVSLSAMVVDVGFNATGAWPYIRNLGNTDIWRMILEMTNTQSVPSRFIIGGLCVMVGLFIAGAVEYFWNLDSEV